MNDLQLAEQLASGNEEAFSKFYTEYHQRIFSVCYRILRYREDAEETVQDVFMQILRTVHSFKGSSRLATWIHRVAVNHCLMRLRLSNHKFWRDKIDRTEEHEAILNSRSTTPSFDLNIDLRLAMKHLPRGYKNVLLLHDIEGLDHMQIARILGVAEGTSKSQLHQAHLKMRKLINKKQNPKTRNVVHSA